MWCGLHSKLNLYVSFIKGGWVSDLLLTNKKLTKVNRELKSPTKGWGFSQEWRTDNE